MRRVFTWAVVMWLTASSGWAYSPPETTGERQPHDAKLANGAMVKLPKAGLDFLAGQLESGLQTELLRRTIVDALEGQYFQIVLPIFGGNLRLTIPCGTENPNKGVNDVPDLNFDDDNVDPETRPWCPYVHDDQADPNVPLQMALPPVTTGTDDGFRYKRVALAASTYPIANLAQPQPNSLFAALYLLEDNGLHAQLDMVPDHPLFKIEVPVITTDPENPANIEVTYQCFNLLGQGGCETTFIATLEADLVTGGQLKPYFVTNTLYVLVNDFHTAISGLRILTPITENQNQGLLGALEACIATGTATGVAAACQAQKDQILLLYDTVEVALGDAALQFFERELNAALSKVLQDGINQLIFDREKDGTPDQVINLDALAAGLTELSGKQFAFNFDARYESSPTNPNAAYFILDGGLYTEEFAPCVDPGSNPTFPYTHLELDGNAGHDPPQMTEFIPGTSLPYQLGLAMSDDLVNQLAYNMWAAGLLCASISANDPNLPEGMGELLTTDNFAPFLKWLPELAPHAPLIIQVTATQPPYVTLGDVGDGSLFRLHVPAVDVDIYVEKGWGKERRPIRAFGLSADITAAVEIIAVNFDKKPLIDLALTFDSGSVISYNDLHPESNKQLMSLLPVVLDLLGPELAKVVGNLEVPGLDNCIGGLTQRDLVLHTSGKDPVSGLDNYLEIYLNFGGLLAFDKLISECLLVLEAAPPSAGADLGILTTNPVSIDAAKAAGVDTSRGYRVRYDGGFWSPLMQGETAQRLMVDGRHRVAFDQDGRQREMSFTVDSAGPVLRTTMAGAKFTAEAIDLGQVEMRIDSGAWRQTASISKTLRAGRHTVRLAARDAAGHVTEKSVIVTVAESDSGCSTARGGALWPVILAVALILLRRRRSIP